MVDRLCGVRCAAGAYAVGVVICVFCLRCVPRIIKSRVYKDIIRCGVFQLVEVAGYDCGCIREAAVQQLHYLLRSGNCG